MSTMTAQCLIGYSHPYDGGINPTHQLFLSENGHLAWSLKSLARSANANGNPRIVWISSLEYMLEDGLLMILLYVIQDKEMLVAARQWLPLEDENFIDFGNFPEEIRMKLYQLAKQRYEEQYTNLKIVLNLLNGSSLLKEWEKLLAYPFEIEVTLSKYDRFWNPFTKKMEIREGVERI